jgi:3-deoxy-D-manno-octulosonic-acid transferase
MHALYNFAIRLYGIAIFIFSFFNKKAKSWIEGRKNWKQSIENLPQNVIWFHCASLGEFDQGLPVMKEMKLIYPNHFLLVTFFSPSGMEHYHKRNHCVDLAIYLPIDTTQNAIDFLKLTRPKIGVFVKYEFWANYILEAKKQKIKIVSIATILRKNQIYFKYYGSFFRNMLRSIDYFFVQNDATKTLLNSIEIENVVVVGDTRFDNVLANKRNFKMKLENSLNKPNVFNDFLRGQKAVIFGSSWQPEEAILEESLSFLKNEKIILAPHDVSESNVARLVKKFGNNAIRHTQFENYNQQSILILDTIGHLSTAYYFGKIAFIGGGFSGKLHNILEPAVFGLPVFFGPKHTKFPEATNFIEEGFAFHVECATEFRERLNFVSENEKAISKRASDFIEKQKGAAERIVNDLKLF